jgi:chromosome segregation protein
MLKRLLLAGFKSFADRVEFDFPAGITAVVGPNGSGKSNIVDAVRWVLGEQSAKSLRGSEMADVIFNGSATRRSLGLAEVTLTFDNSRRSLASNAEEIQIGRRVWRSGESEYLLNQQPCRLKDIKDLFLGSGAGTDAYSIIEQGRVDVLLQASTKERRTIFEEAAGISRFKARKAETLRKLERVDHNVERLKDIIGEVEKSLRSARLAAAKAQRYQEHSGRLRELRVGLGLREYGAWAGCLADVNRILEGLRAGLREELAQAETWERQLGELEQSLQRLDGAVRTQDALRFNAEQRITSDRATLTHETDRSDRLEDETARTRSQLVELTLRAAALARAAAEAARELDEAEGRAAEVEEGVRRLEEDRDATRKRLQELQQQHQEDRDRHLELMNQAIHRRNEATGLKAERDRKLWERDRARRKKEQVTGDLLSLERDLAEMAEAGASLKERKDRLGQELAEKRQEREHLQQLQTDTTRLAAEMRAERSGLASRIEILEGLERSHEGLDTGGREVFALLEQPNPGPWRTILGIVADFLTVRREYAPLIDLALGERARYFLVRDPVLLRAALEQRGQPFSGRVSFYLLTPANGEVLPRRNRLIETSHLARVRMPVSAEGKPAHPGVVALAEQVVTCDHPLLGDLPRRLLSRALIVRDLTVARAIAAHTAGFRFITLQGELLEADGTLTVGTHHAETSILSRKSELRELREQVARLDDRLAEIELDVAELARRVAEAEGETDHLAREIVVLERQAAELAAQLKSQRDKQAELQQKFEGEKSDLETLEEQIQSLEESWRQAGEQAAAAEEQVSALQRRMSEAQVEIRERDQHFQACQQECTEAQVTLAQVKGSRDALRRRVTDNEGELARERQQCRLAEARLAELRQHLRDNTAKLLQASSSLARGYTDKEAAERALAGLHEQRERERSRHQELDARAKVQRQSWQGRQEEMHAREMDATHLQNRLDNLTLRLHEDYQIGLRLADTGRPEAFDTAGVVIAAEPIPDSGREEAEKEIEELKKKLSRLGSVNLDALQELQDLELRASTLQAQFDDLTAAKKSLEDIIGRINVDSRRLFSETLETVRGHFQELFRKLFGGGQADIVLEDEADVLESGIEIIARPPGKELRSISLMSGGEKTLTAVALLLAIFRSKPSPFCILDEVDAALDEANVGRLAAVLREFLDRSQFILITHSKRTMASADVLYGITMQESGISKRVAVRFEDWPDDERTPQKDAEQEVA